MPYNLLQTCHEQSPRKERLEKLIICYYNQLLRPPSIEMLARSRSNAITSLPLKKLRVPYEYHRSGGILSMATHRVLYRYLPDEFLVKTLSVAYWSVRRSGHTVLSASSNRKIMTLNDLEKQRYTDEPWSFKFTLIKIRDYAQFALDLECSGEGDVLTQDDIISTWKDDDKSSCILTTTLLKAAHWEYLASHHKDKQSSEYRYQLLTATLYYQKACMACCYMLNQNVSYDNHRNSECILKARKQVFLELIKPSLVRCNDLLIEAYAPKPKDSNNQEFNCMVDLVKYTDALKSDSGVRKHFESEADELIRVKLLINWIDCKPRKRVILCLHAAYCNLISDDLASDEISAIIKQHKQLDVTSFSTNTNIIFCEVLLAAQSDEETLKVLGKALTSWPFYLTQKLRLAKFLADVVTNESHQQKLDAIDAIDNSIQNKLWQLIEKFNKPPDTDLSLKLANYFSTRCKDQPNFDRRIHYCQAAIKAADASQDFDKQQQAREAYNEACIDYAKYFENLALGNIESKKDTEHEIQQAKKYYQMACQRNHVPAIVSYSNFLQMRNELEEAADVMINGLKNSCITYAKSYLLQRTAEPIKDTNAWKNYQQELVAAEIAAEDKAYSDRIKITCHAIVEYFLKPRLMNEKQTEIKMETYFDRMDPCDLDHKAIITEFLVSLLHQLGSHKNISKFLRDNTDRLGKAADSIKLYIVHIIQCCALPTELRRDFAKNIYQSLSGEEFSELRQSIHKHFEHETPDAFTSIRAKTPLNLTDKDIETLTDTDSHLLTEMAKPLKSTDSNTAPIAALECCASYFVSEDCTIVDLWQSLRQLAMIADLTTIDYSQTFTETLRMLICYLVDTNTFTRIVNAVKRQLLIRLHQIDDLQLSQTHVNELTELMDLRSKRFGSQVISRKDIKKLIGDGKLIIKNPVQDNGTSTSEAPNDASAATSSSSSSTLPHLHTNWAANNAESKMPDDDATELHTFSQAKQIAP